MKKIRLGGVPEHFNYPVRQAIEEKEFASAGINLHWQTFPGGTGDMTRALRNNTCDVCILLTEGIITDIINGSPSKIISGYVSSPLIWGVHTGTGQEVRYGEAFGNKIAVSRLGSGSHLMPTVDALLKGESINPDQFIVVNDISGAISSLNNEESSIFYWEKYTTKPYVEKKQLKRIGEFISPWPCFMIAATDRIINEDPVTLDRMLRIIHQVCAEFMENPLAPTLVSRQYNLDLRDATYWFHSTEWATNSWVSNKMLNSVLFTLKEAGIVDGNSVTDKLVWRRH